MADDNIDVIILVPLYAVVGLFYEFLLRQNGVQTHCEFILYGACFGFIAGAFICIRRDYFEFIQRRRVE